MFYTGKTVYKNSMTQNNLEAFILITLVEIIF